MKVIFYDSETQNLPLWNEPSEHPNQPHICQLAACLVDADTRKTIASMDVIVRPDGWTIPDEVVKIHGITTERARDVGVQEATALALFDELWKVADTRIAYNESFDARILRIAYLRYRNEVEADAWKAGPAICAARLATPIMNMAPTEAMVATGRNHAKMPKLSEAFQHFTGSPLQNAHSAIVDVRAAMEVYFKIIDREKQS